MAYHETRTRRLWPAHATLQASAVRNVKSYRSFHIATLWFPGQIIKGRATSYLVEVYCRIWGASAV